MYTKPCDKIYHVFTDNFDEWIEDIKKAKKLFLELAREFGSARLYIETEWDEDEGLFINEDCLMTYGHFPY